MNKNESIGSLGAAENKKFSRHKVIFLSLLGADLAAFVVAFFAGAGFGYSVNYLLLGEDYIVVSEMSQVVERGLVFSVLTALCLIWFITESHYDTERDNWKKFGNAFKIIVFVFCIDVASQYTSKQSFSRLWLIGSWLFLIALLPIFFALCRSILIRTGYWGRPTIVLRSRNVDYSVSSLLQAEWPHLYDVLTEVNLDFVKTPDIRERIEAVVKEARKTKVLVILVVDASEINDIDQLCVWLERQGIDFYLLPELGSAARRGLYQDLQFRNGIPFVSGSNKLLRRSNRIIKRAIDLVLSVFLLVILAIPMLIIAMVVKSDGASVFFGHERIGFGGRPFKCLKFRSMCADADQVLERLLAEDPEFKKQWESDVKLKDDPRVSKVGKFLRKTSLDELPQLFNVLIGQMSLVGPRPVVLDELEKFYGQEASLYTAVLPGITGLWQVSGRSNTSYERRVDLDARYARNWSLFLDIKILLLTPVVVVSQKGAY